MQAFVGYLTLIAIVTWTVTREEIFAELREWADERMSEIDETDANSWGELTTQLAHRKLYYPLTCQFCFSFWVTLAVELLFRVRYFDSRILTHTVLWAGANVLMSLYENVRVRIAERRGLTEYNGVVTRQAQVVLQLQQLQLDEARKHRRLIQDLEAKAAVQTPRASWLTVEGQS